MNRLGIGPRLAPLSISYFIATVVLSVYWKPLFNLVDIPDALRLGIGIAFITVGIVLYAAALRAMLKAYKADKLCTTGAFGICRHPIYSAWICFLVPGMAFLVNSLLSFTTPLVMYGLFKVLIPKEDQHLQKRFGAEYLRYRKITPELLPFGWLKRVKT